MCVIYVCKDEIPPLEELAAGASNDDGAGVAWVDTIKGHPRVRWHKGLKDEHEVHEITKDLKPPVMIHFRLATIGGKTPLLTHPFPLTERAPLALTGDTVAVMAHNGHWNKWDDVLKDLCARSGKMLPAGPWSDSRAMAWIISNFGIGMLNITAEYQKVAVLHAVKGFSIVNQSMWYEKKGWMQSSSTTSRRKSSWPGFHGSLDDTGDFGADWRGGVGTTYVPPPPTATARPDGVSYYRPHTTETLKKVVRPIQITLGAALEGPKGLLLPSSATVPTTVDAEVISAKTVIQGTTKTDHPKIVLGPDDVSEAEIEHYLHMLMHNGVQIMGHA